MSLFWWHQSALCFSFDNRAVTCFLKLSRRGGGRQEIHEEKKSYDDRSTETFVRNRRQFVSGQDQSTMVNMCKTTEGTLLISSVICFSNTEGILGC